MESKRCTKCGAEKPLEDFYAYRGRLYGDCKRCHNAATVACAKARKERDPEAHRAYHNQRAAQEREVRRERCRQWYRENLAYARQKGLESAMRWAEAHPEEAKANKKRHYDANRARFKDRAARRRAAKRGVDTDRVLREAVFKRDDHRCWYCGREVHGYDATIDHVQAITRGGSHTMDNLRTACQDCNRRKGASTPYEWFARDPEAGERWSELRCAEMLLEADE